MEKACGTLQGRQCPVDPTAQCLSGEEREADSLADESHQGQGLHGTRFSFQCRLSGCRLGHQWEQRA
ncbi:hypothetical protein EOD39_6533 [Acipenser ruthenus]|uniref:Uncharacterized protein n=1 Tax=Acipenser ruthenus TaxID=7906 RepID=A0A444U9T9_ACIRT|nr:hypothetical protein EOD39_6533 [Acipenser ruthenus]